MRRVEAGQLAPGAPVPVGLDRDTVVAAALDLIDERGVGAFTVRALGERLGVRAPTIYWHVGTKAELLEAVVDRVVVDTAPSLIHAGTWHERVCHLLAVVRGQLQAHPRVTELLRTVHSRAYELWIREALEIARAAGFPSDQAPGYARAIVTTALACAQSEANILAAPYMEVDPADATGRRYRVRPEVLRDGLPVDVALTTTYDVDDEFDRMVRIFVAGLAAQLGDQG